MRNPEGFNPKESGNKLKSKNKLLVGIMVLTGSLVAAACNTNSNPVLPPDRPSRPKNPMDTDNENQNSESNESTSESDSNTPRRQIRIDEKTGDIYKVLSNDELENSEYSQIPIHFDPKTGEFYRALSDNEKSRYGYGFHEEDNDPENQKIDKAGYAKRFDKRISDQFGDFIKAFYDKRRADTRWTYDFPKGTPAEQMTHELDSIISLQFNPNQLRDGLAWIERNEIPVDLIIMLAMRLKGQPHVSSGARFYAAQLTTSSTVLGHLAYDCNTPETAKAIIENDACLQYTAVRLLENENEKIQLEAAKSPLLPKHVLKAWIEKHYQGNWKGHYRYSKDLETYYHTYNNTENIWDEKKVLAHEKLTDEEVREYSNSPHAKLRIAAITSGRLTDDDFKRLTNDSHQYVRWAVYREAPDSIRRFVLEQLSKDSNSYIRSKAKEQIKILEELNE
ncbi:hypothetical protein ACFL3T_00490 [Patescibacteria group bacterium]